MAMTQIQPSRKGSSSGRGIFLLASPAFRFQHSAVLLDWLV